MGLIAFTTALRTLLTTDATFQSDIAALIGQPVNRLLKANTPWQEIGNNLLPCFVLEQGDGRSSSIDGGDASGLVIGHYEQEFTSSMDVCLLWNQQDREAAADQRAALPEIFARLLMRNPQPGEVAGAWLNEWIPDQGVRHPLQCWVARIHAEYTIGRDP